MTRQATDDLYIELDYYTPENYYVYVAEATSVLSTNATLACEPGFLIEPTNPVDGDVVEFDTAASVAVSAGVITLASVAITGAFQAVMTVNAQKNGEVLIITNASMDATVNKVVDPGSVLEYQADLNAQASIFPLLERPWQINTNSTASDIFESSIKKTGTHSFTIQTFALDGIENYAIWDVRKEEIAPVVGSSSDYWSLEFWVYDNNANPNLFAIYDDFGTIDSSGVKTDTDPDKKIIRGYIDSNHKLVVQILGRNSVASFTALSADSWNHISIKVKQDTVKYFINGSFDRSYTITTSDYNTALDNLDVNVSLMIGLDDNFLSEYVFTAPVYLDEFRISKGANSTVDSESGIAWTASTYTEPTLGYYNQSTTKALFRFENNFVDTTKGVTEFEADLNSTANLASNSGKLLETSSSQSSEFSIFCEPTKILQDQIVMSSQFNIDIEYINLVGAASDLQCQVSISIDPDYIIPGEATISSAATFNLSVTILVPVEINLSAEFSTTATAIVEYEANANLSVETTQNTLAGKNVEAVADFDAIASILVIGRELVIDNIVYVVPQEIRAYTIHRETRGYIVPNETRQYTIKDEA